MVDRAPRFAHRLAAADLVLPSFTDEELAAIRPPGPTLVPSPGLDRLDATCREAVVAAARRSLAAQRHLVRGVGGFWQTAGPLRLVAQFRSAPAVVIVARRSGPSEPSEVGARWIYGSGGAALDEWLDPDLAGVHRFVLRDANRTGAALAAWLMRPGASALSIGEPAPDGRAHVAQLSVTADGSTATVGAAHGETHRLDGAGLATFVAAALTAAPHGQPTSVASRSS